MVSVHAIFFHKVSPIVLHQTGTSVYMPCRYHALSCSRSKFLTALITYSSASNFVPRIAPFRAPNSLKYEGRRSGLWGGCVNIAPTNFVIAAPLFLRTCVQPCWSKISFGFKWNLSRSKRFRVLSASIRIISSQPQWSWPCPLTDFFFSPRRLKTVPFHGLS